MLMHKAASSLLHLRNAANVIPQSVKAAFQGGSQAASGGIINVQSVGAGSSSGSAGGAWNAGRNFSGYPGSGRAFSQTVPGTNSTGTANANNEEDDEFEPHFKAAGRSRSNSFSSSGVGRSARGKKMGTLQLVQMQSRFRQISNLATKSAVATIVSEVPSSPAPNVLLVRRNSTSAVKNDSDAPIDHWTPNVADSSNQGAQQISGNALDLNEYVFGGEEGFRTNLDNIIAFKPIDPATQEVAKLEKQKELVLILKAAAYKGSVNLFESVASLEAEGSVIGLDVYRAALSEMLRTRDAGFSIDPIRFMWNSMCVSGLKPDKPSFETIIMALCVREGEIAERLGNPNITKSERTQLISEQNLDAAASLVKETDRIGLLLSVEVYEYIMLLCRDSEHDNMSKEMFNIIDQNSHIVEPTPIMLQVLMDKASQLDDSSSILGYLERSKTYSQKLWPTQGREDVWLTCIKHLHISGAKSDAQILVDQIKTGSKFAPQHTSRLDLVEIWMTMESSMAKAVELLNESRVRHSGTRSISEAYTMLLEEAINIDDVHNMNLVWKAMIEDHAMFSGDFCTGSRLQSVITHNIDNIIRGQSKEDQLTLLIQKSLLALKSPISNQICTAIAKQLLRINDLESVFFILKSQQNAEEGSRKEIYRQAQLLIDFCGNHSDNPESMTINVLRIYGTIHDLLKSSNDSISTGCSKILKTCRSKLAKPVLAITVLHTNSLFDLVLSLDLSFEENRPEYYSCWDLIDDLCRSSTDFSTIEKYLPLLERQIRLKSQPVVAVLMISKLRRIKEASQHKPVGHVLENSDQLSQLESFPESPPPVHSKIQIRHQIQYPMVSKINKELTQSLLEENKWHHKRTAIESFDRLHQHIGNEIYPDAISLAGLIARLGNEKFPTEMHHTYNLAQQVLQFTKLNQKEHLEAWILVEDAMIRGCSAVSLNGQAMVHRQRIIDIGSVPSAEAYACLIVHSTDSSDDASLSLGLWQEARSLGCTLNTFSYNTIISRLAKARKLSMCLNLLQEMKVNEETRPTVVTYGAILNACCRIGDEESAEHYFKEMTQVKNYRPKLAPFNTMMQFYTNTMPNRSKFNKYYEMLKETNLSFSEHTYKLLLQAAGHIHPIDATQMMKIFNKIALSKTVNVTGSHWATILTSCGDHQNDIQAMKLVFEQIAEHPASLKSGSILPDTLCYEAVFTCLLKSGLSADIKPYIERMKLNGLRPSTYTENVRISAAIAEGDIAEARSIFETMVDPHVGASAPDSPTTYQSHVIYRQPSTWQRMIEGELDEGNIELAENLISRMGSRLYPQSIMKKVNDMLKTRKEALLE